MAEMTPRERAEAILAAMPGYTWTRPLLPVLETAIAAILLAAAQRSTAMSNIYDDMIELLERQMDQCVKDAAGNASLEDNEYAAGYLSGLRQGIILIKAAKIAVVQVPHLGEVS